jgi:lysozyme
MTVSECWDALREEMQVKMNYALEFSPILNEEANGWRLVAITDFIYNIGQGAYENSTLRKKVDAGDWDGAVVQIRRWNRAGGKVLRGLDNRRKDEAEMLLKDA